MIIYLLGNFVNTLSCIFQVLLQEAQEEAVQAALNVYNTEAVGGGPVRKKYEKQLHATLKRQFEVLFLNT